MKIIGISGPSCSGKSTLSRHLRSILPDSACLYEDDFYLPENELPLDSFGNPNWDCPGSFNLSKMRREIIKIKKTNTLPPQNTREEFNNNSGVSLLSKKEQEYFTQLAKGTEKVLIVDGILLFHLGSELMDLFDLRLLIPFNKLTLKERREARVGYETPDGEFWQDPPNYFNDLVWPEFLRHSAFLYTPNGDEYTEISQEGKKGGVYMADSQELSRMVGYALNLICTSHTNEHTNEVSMSEL